MDSVTKARIITFSFFLFVLIILIYLFKRNKKETFKNKIVNTPNNPVNRFKNDRDTWFSKAPPFVIFLLS